MRDKAAREKLFRKLVRQQQIGMRFARALAKRRRGFVDRLLVALAARMAPQPSPANDFMRDPLIDGAPEYSIEELKRFREGKTPRDA